MRAVKVQELRDPAAQISYLLKFTTFHRPGSQNGSRRPRAVPLPDDALKQLTLWRARHGFFDFLFMIGLRRRGGDLVQIDNEKCSAECADYGAYAAYAAYATEEAKP